MITILAVKYVAAYATWCPCVALSFCALFKDTSVCSLAVELLVLWVLGNLLSYTQAICRICPLLCCHLNINLCGSGFCSCCAKAEGSQGRNSDGQG